MLGALGLLIGVPAAVVGVPDSSSVLTVSSPRIDMGEVAAGGRQEVAFSLTNSGTRPIELGKIESSCPCLTIDLPRGVLAPAEQIHGRARLDLRKEPAFAGDLGVEVRGFTARGDLAFTMIVEITVRRGKTPGFSANAFSNSVKGDKRCLENDPWRPLASEDNEAA